jgi:hypothetical protein
MSSIADHDTVISLINKFCSGSEVACLDKRSRNVYIEGIHSKYWFDKINNYFKSLDLNACCYKTYSNKINWKSRYIDIEDSELKTLNKFETKYVNTIVDRYFCKKPIKYSSENLIIIDEKYNIFPELWLQDNSYNLFENSIKYDDIERTVRLLMEGLVFMREHFHETDFETDIHMIIYDNI